MHSVRELTVHVPVLESQSDSARPKGQRLLKALFAAMLGRSTPPEGSIDPNFNGHAWCDSLERQVTFDITSCRRTWLF